MLHNLSSIALAGNLFKDRIFLCDDFQLGNSNTAKDFKSSFGGIKTMFKWFVDDKYIPKCFDSIHPALAFILVENGRKTSIVNWGDSLKYTGKDIVEYYSYTSERPGHVIPWPQIVHFAYLDSLPNLSEDVLKKLKEKGAKLSCDFCKSETEILENKHLLKYFDYFFASDNEFKTHTDMIRQIGSHNKNAVCFHHSPESSCWFSLADEASTISHFKNELIAKPLHLVGAGDIFASKILKNLLDKNFEVVNFDVDVREANQECLKFIKDNS